MDNVNKLRARKRIGKLRPLLSGNRKCQVKDVSPFLLLPKGVAAFNYALYPPALRNDPAI